MPHVVMKRHHALCPRGALHAEANLAVVALLDRARVEEGLGLQLEVGPNPGPVETMMDLKPYLWVNYYNSLT